MLQEDINESGARVFLTVDELLIISNALNEVCHGLEDTGVCDAAGCRIR